MNRIKCFWLEPTLECRQWARTYERNDVDCGANGYHQGMRQLPDGQLETYERPDWPDRVMHRRVENPAECDVEFPGSCDKCGHVFADGAQRHILYRRLYVDENGTRTTTEEAAAGAMWDASWNPKCWKGADGMSVTVKTPGGDWTIDAQCSNCTMPDDQTHKCWVRHGTPPLLTVDKNGHTCGAGAGSIAQPGYHGFLRNGYLEQC